MSKEIIEALRQIEKEKGIAFDTLMSALEDALHSAYKKSPDAVDHAKVEIDPTTGEIRVYQLIFPEDVDVESLRVLNEEGDEIGLDLSGVDESRIERHEVTPDNFGRIAAQTAKQAMLQRIRQVEKNMVFEEFKGRGGDILSGTVRRFERSDVIVDLGKIEGVMPSRERVPTEEYQPGYRIRAFTLSVENALHGPEIILSRSHPDFVRKLFELEV